LLLADDSLTIQKVVSLTFNDEAMEVLTVGSGAEALEKLQESLPDIVLADVFMPGPNGYELCDRIKSDARTRHLPVVLLVGTFEPFNEAEARRVGADEILTKPFQSIRDLVNKVGGLLGGSDEKSSPEARDEQSAEETTQDLSPFAADARAANPNIETAAAATSTTAADAFNDFDMDDATIQSTSAAAFDARAGQTAPAALEIREEEQFSDRGETDEAFVLGLDESPTQTHAPAANTAALASGNSYSSASNASTEGAPVASAASSFSTHAARAAEADDALLELSDDIAPAHRSDALAIEDDDFKMGETRASAADDSLLELDDIAPARSGEADDFILDMGDEDSFAPVAAAPTNYATPPEHDAVAEVDMLFAENAPLTAAPEAFAEPEAFNAPHALTEPEVSAAPHAPAASEAWGDAEMWASPAATVAESEPTLLAEEPEAFDAPEISASPSLLFANEPAVESRGAESFAEQESERYATHALAWDGEPVAASIVAHAGSVARVESYDESQLSEPLAADASAAAVAAGASSINASPESSHAASSTSAPQLSPEALDEVVRRVVAHISEQVLREIAWEVVPELAERLIKQRLEEERTRTTP
jgi:CheY-like chemotaxis protein